MCGVDVEARGCIKWSMSRFGGGGRQDGGTLQKSHILPLFVSLIWLGWQMVELGWKMLQNFSLELHTHTHHFIFKFCM